VIIPLRHSDMARVLKGSHSFTCTPWNEPYLPVCGISGHEARSLEFLIPTGIGTTCTRH